MLSLQVMNKVKFAVARSRRRATKLYLAQIVPPVCFPTTPARPTYISPFVSTDAPNFLMVPGEASKISHC